MPRTIEAPGAGEEPLVANDPVSGWVLSRLMDALDAARRVGARAIERSGQPHRVLDLPGAYVVDGLWCFCLVAEEPALLFRIGDQPFDAVVWDAGAGAFVCWSDPREALEPVGYVRATLLNLLQDAALLSQREPRSSEVRALGASVKDTLRAPAPDDVADSRR